ncbi:hypothetical protein PLICRDRAFT_108566 [Plicaturopsis crispa FD-325 SS-3]|nr:hypothetical protein PLICRDRAFT_108566 [Plicaturopsis crispa FD-325 SS-3]
MRFYSLLSGGIALAGLFLSVVASEGSTEPEILVSASFPEDNPFGHVVNGEKNKLTLVVENKSNRNVTLKTVAGSVHQPETNSLIKNTTSLTYGLSLLEGTKVSVPYTFHSEYKPGDVRLNVWLEHTVDGETYRVTAYDSIVKVVEPELSIFDFKLISTYLMVAALLSGLGYFAYLTFVPQTKRTRPKAQEVSAPVGTVTATGAGGYQEEWIPEHHLKKTKSGKKRGGALSSGDEHDTSGAETSGTEGRKRKGRK